MRTSHSPVPATRVACYSYAAPASEPGKIAVREARGGNLSVTYMQWYYADNGRQAGPVSDLALELLHSEGKIQDSTLLWRSGMTDWQPYSEVFASTQVNRINPATTATSAEPAADIDRVPCSRCNSLFAVEELLRYGNASICATCKPLFFQKLREGADSGERQYAGFWLRVGATLIDSLLLGGVLMVILFGLMFALGFFDLNRGEEEDLSQFIAFQLMLMLFQVVIPWLFEATFTSRYGGTPGKLLLRMQVIREDGSRPSFALATGRHFAKWLSSMTLSIGYIMVGFDQEKRGLHDYVANTRVIVR